ncbi:hypothetical protein V3G39_16055 [Dermatophilaceae bacterium Sec6.4]
MPEDDEDLSGLGAGPTLVICGREDQITPLEGSELMAAEIPGRTTTPAARAAGVVVTGGD